LGIIPDNLLARRFRDAAGLLHQRIAAQVDSVDMVMAGLVQRWKTPHSHRASWNEYQTDEIPPIKYSS
jgi:adenosylcobinamide kinase/adenosylcobinamide-phosphate guanylyltransferase